MAGIKPLNTCNACNFDNPGDAEKCNKCGKEFRGFAFVGKGDWKTTVFTNVGSATFAVQKINGRIKLAIVAILNPTIVQEVVLLPQQRAFP